MVLKFSAFQADDAVLQPELIDALCMDDFLQKGQMRSIFISELMNWQRLPAQYRPHLSLEGILLKF